MSAIHRHSLWLLPVAFVFCFVVSWPGLLQEDDGSGLPWMGTFALGLPWSAITAIVVPGDGVTSGLRVGLALSGFINLLLVALYAKRQIHRSRSN